MKLNISLFFQSPANIFIFRHVSPRVSRCYLQLIGFLYYLVNRKEKRRIAKNVRDLLAGREEPDIEKVTRDTFKGIFSHYFEKMCSAFMKTEAIEQYVRHHVRVVRSVERHVTKERSVVALVEEADRLVREHLAGMLGGWLWFRQFAVDEIGERGFGWVGHAA